MKYRMLTMMLAICSLLVLAAAGAVGAQSMDKMDEMDSMGMMDDMMKMDSPPSCTMLPDSINIMVISDSPGIECQQVSGGGIGEQSILDAGPLNALNVWGSMDIYAEVCFDGAGSILFLDAMFMPHAQRSLDYSMRDDMTCTYIGGPGTVILMPSMMMDDDMGMMDDMDTMDDMDAMDAMAAMPTMDDMDEMDDMDAMDEMDGMDDMDAMDEMDDMDKMDDMKMDYAMMKDSMDSMIPLENCELVTRYSLNFRDEPGGEKIGLVPGGTSKTPVARTPNWFNVEHDDVLGWISAHFIEGEGDCG